MTRATYFATCAPGVEAVLHDEIRALRFAKVERQVGGVRFEGTRQDAWRANLWLRSAVRVLERVVRFEARDDTELYARASDVDWSRALTASGRLWVDAQTRESELDHSRFIEQRVKDAIVDQLRAADGSRPAVDRDDPDLRVHVHVFRNRVTLSLDTSGASLHKRGWRRFQGRAPLAENLAAALVLASGWNQRAPLVDPFCGSGTILIEAALLAGNAPPGGLRSFGFERWPGHDHAGFDALRQEALAGVRYPKKLRLYGADRHAEIIVGARQNVEAAGLGDVIQLDVCSAADFPFKSGWNAWIVSNLPYGERVSAGQDVAALYREFGRRLRESCAGYNVTLLSGSDVLSRALELENAERVSVLNGGLECERLTATIAR